MIRKTEMDLPNSGTLDGFVNKANITKVKDFSQENVSIILNYFFNSGENFN
jgi:hypothetical protein